MNYYLSTSVSFSYFSANLVSTTGCFEIKLDSPIFNNFYWANTWKLCCYKSLYFKNNTWNINIIFRNVNITSIFILGFCYHIFIWWLFYCLIILFDPLFSFNFYALLLYVNSWFLVYIIIPFKNILSFEKTISYSNYFKKLICYIELSFL